jgi:hypothetical protein
VTKEEVFDTLNRRQSGLNKNVSMKQRFKKMFFFENYFLVFSTHIWVFIPDVLLRPWAFTIKHYRFVNYGK